MNHKNVLDPESVASFLRANGRLTLLGNGHIISKEKTV